jgi:hypothetical protein
MTTFFSMLLLVHSILRYLILVLIGVVLYRSFTGLRNNNNFSIKDNKFSLYLLIASHTMLLIGLIQYFFGEKGLKLIQAHGMKVAMKDSLIRFFSVEHSLTMVLAIILIQLGRNATKKLVHDKIKHKKIFYFTLMALLLILLRMPWPFMDAFKDRGWL